MEGKESRKTGGQKNKNRRALQLRRLVWGGVFACAFSSHPPWTEIKNQK
jgi:hypothetical protein